MSTAIYVDEQPASGNLATYRYAAYLIANCPTFQEVILDVASASEALEKVYIQETLADAHPDLHSEYEGDEPPEIEARPFCVLTDSTRQSVKIGYGTWSNEGVIIACFECLVPDELKIDFAQDGVDVIRQKFRRRVDWRLQIAGAIEDEIRELSGLHDPDGHAFLNVVDTDQIIPPSDPEAAQAEDHIGFALALRWK